MKKLLYIIVFVLAAIVVFQQYIITEQSKNAQMIEGMLNEERQHHCSKLAQYDSLMNAYYDSLITKWELKHH